MDYSAIIFVFGLWGSLEAICLLQWIGSLFAPTPLPGSRSKAEFIEQYGKQEERTEDWQHVAVVRARSKGDLDRLKGLDIEIVKKHIKK